MAGSVASGLRATGICLAVTAAALAVAQFVPDSATRLARLGGLGAALLLAGMAFWLISRRLSQSLAEVIDVARAIGGGDYRRRLHLSPGGEFVTLAEAVN